MHTPGNDPHLQHPRPQITRLSTLLAAFTVSDMTPFLQRYSQSNCQIGRDWFSPLATGWFLVEIMKLDRARPGILRHATEAPPLWRNAVAVALSSGVLGAPESFLLRANGDVGPESTDVQIANAFMMMMKPVDILEAAYSEVPPSLPGILKRIGSSLLNTCEAYGRLYALMTSHHPEQQARRRVLERINAKLDDELIQVVEILDIGILSPKTAMAVRTATAAHSVNLRVPIIKQLVSSANEESLRQSIEDAPNFRASNWVRSWLGKSDRMPPLGIPLDNDPGVRIMPSTARAMAREWNNCLAGHSHSMATGATAYFAIPDLHVIVVLTRTDGGWLLTGMHGRANMPVSAETAQQVRQKLSSQGVICLMPIGPPPELEAIAGVFHSVDDLDFDFHGMGG